jgi:hypothetical protein
VNFLKSISTIALCCALSSAIAGEALAQAKDYHFGYAGPKEEKAIDTTKILSESGATTNPPSAYDISKYAVDAGTQGKLNSCVGWTIGHDLVGWYSNYHGKSVTEFAPMYVYSQVNEDESKGVSGTAYAVDAIKIVINQGVAPEADYTQGYYDLKDLPTQAEKDSAAKYKPQFFSNYYVIFASYNGNGGADLTKAIKLAIANNHPVAIGMIVRPGFKKLDANSLSDTDVNGENLGKHEVLAVGYNANGLVVENHWGKDWGSTGFGTISWKVVEQDVLEAVYTY